jgi:ferredoxin
MGTDFYEIAPSRCTECVGHFDEPQCQVVCPVACIEGNPEWVETSAQLRAKVEALGTLPAVKSDN